MLHSASNGPLTMPNLSGLESKPSSEDRTLAPELNRAFLVVEPSPFAAGALSDIFGGLWVPPEDPEGVEVAVKVLRIANQSIDPGPASENKKYGKHLGREIFVWQRIRHPRITPLIGYIRDFKDGVPCIVTKRRTGDILEYLAANPEADRLSLVCQAVEGLVYLHKFQPNPIIHLKFKPSNILVTDEGEAELCDFGQAKVLEVGSTGFTTSPNPAGAYPYMSPETFMGAEWKDLTPATDIFAMGSTILYILSGKSAWNSIKAKGMLLMKIMNGIPPAREDNPMEGSEEAVDTLWDLLVRCWKQDPNDRPSVQEALDTLLEIEAMGGIRPLSSEHVTSLPLPLLSEAELLDDVPELAPELNIKYLTVESSPFAKGGFSDVFRGRWAPPEHPEGINVAVKVLRMPPPSTDLETAEDNVRYGKYLGRELSVWQRANHPRITPLVGYIRDFRDGVPCIVTKRRQGNLLTYLSENPEANRLKLLCQVVEGLIYLHTFRPNPIVHLDIKPGNILVTEEGDAELCDFGYAKVLGKFPSGFTPSSNPGGTYPYMSPEVVSGGTWESLTPKADIFAMGSTILYILSGQRAWYFIQAIGPLTAAVMQGTPPKREKYPMDGSARAINLLWNLLVRCWSKEPKNRPSAQEVLRKLRAIEAAGGVRPPTPPAVVATD